MPCVILAQRIPPQIGGAEPAFALRQFDKALRIFTGEARIDTDGGGVHGFSSRRICHSSMTSSSRRRFLVQSAYCHGAVRDAEEWLSDESNHEYACRNSGARMFPAVNTVNATTGIQFRCVRNSLST